MSSSIVVRFVAAIPRALQLYYSVRPDILSVTGGFIGYLGSLGYAPTYLKDSCCPWWATPLAVPLFGACGAYASMVAVPIVYYSLPIAAPIAVFTMLQDERSG